MSLTEWQYKRLVDTSAVILRNGGSGPCLQPRRCSWLEFKPFHYLYHCHIFLTECSRLSEQFLRCLSRSQRKGANKKNARNQIIAQWILKSHTVVLNSSGFPVLKRNKDARFLDTAKRAFYQVPPTCWCSACQCLGVRGLLSMCSYVIRRAGASDDLYAPADIR